MRSSRVIWAGLVSLGALLPLSGCVVNATYPPRPGESATSDLNIAPGPSVIQEGLQAALSRRPIEGRYVLNLPRGMERAVAERIANVVGQGNAVLPTPEADLSGLPIVHVSRVWIRGDDSEVDVLVPFEGVWQAMTVRMRGTVVQGFEIEGVRQWPPGMIEAPELYGWGDTSAKATSEGDAPAPTESNEAQ